MECCICTKEWVRENCDRWQKQAGLLMMFDHLLHLDLEEMLSLQKVNLTLIVGVRKKMEEEEEEEEEDEEEMDHAQKDSTRKDGGSEAVGRCGIWWRRKLFEPAATSRLSDQLCVPLLIACACEIGRIKESFSARRCRCP